MGARTAVKTARMVEECILEVRLWEVVIGGVVL